MKLRLECQNGSLYFCKFCFPCGCASAQCVPDAKWLSCLRCFHVMLSIVYDTCLFCFSISRRPPAYFVWRFRYRNKTRNKKTPLSLLNVRQLATLLSSIDGETLMVLCL
ncbi:hypothetical protein IscW_ISCW017868 [Ixodes scapularis]|uniref:Uncharacterized protein n=1 Tax=Ixodes scapularis TaxID=6945 RepID=B7PH90_IXOSC|nr:hypothetical protein IscW_ISCW017868 [Ixodes scapularis]|eukprot:XP_002402356.1 hypothetical protein IscW_ISCW017868 [Ixodes scapularis]